MTTWRELWPGEDGKIVGKKKTRAEMIRDYLLEEKHAVDTESEWEKPDQGVICLSAFGNCANRCLQPDLSVCILEDAADSFGPGVRGQANAQAKRSAAIFQISIHARRPGAISIFAGVAKSKYINDSSCLPRAIVFT